MEKHYELAAKSLAQKKLWQYGFKARKVRFSPIDLNVDHKGQQFKVKVVCYSTNEKRLHIPEGAKNADVLAVVVLVPFTTAMVFWLRLGFSHTEPMIGKSYKIGTEGDMIERDFVINPNKAFVGAVKSSGIRSTAPALLAYEWYTPQEIAKYKLLGEQIRSQKVKALVEAKKIKASVWGKGNGKRTRIKGEWIIEYLTKKVD